nr:hypothetical protein [Tanacetum cinerariifolium]
MHEMRKNYNNYGGDHASKNDETPMYERHEVNYIQSGGYQSHHDLNDSEKSVTELNNDVRNDLEHFKRVKNMFFNNNVNDMIIKMKQNEKNCQTKIKNIERKTDEWAKSQNVSLEQTERTEPPPPPQAHTEHVNVVFTGSEESDYSLKILKDPPPPIIVNNKIKKDKPI